MEPSAILALVFGAASAAGSMFQLAAGRQSRRFAALPGPAPPPQWPGVTIMKPLYGDEPELADNLRSFARQTYDGPVQLVFGVAEATDPALAAVAQLQAAHPGADVAVVIDPRQHGANRKVSNLINMMPAARHGLLVFADSDVRVGPDWLATVTAGLHQPGIGLVTCLWAARPVGGACSRLMAMWLNHHFAPAVLVARAMGRRDGCFGQTMALRRTTLDAAGGLVPLADLLADDYELGAAVRRQGLAIALSPEMVELVVHEPDLAGVVAHELRWERTLAMLAPVGHAASVVTKAVPLGLLAALTGEPGGIAILAAALVIRLWVVRRQERLLALPPAPIWMVAARDLLSFGVFIAAACGRTVTWRGHRFRVDRHGRLESQTP